MSGTVAGGLGVLRLDAAFVNRSSVQLTGPHVRGTILNITEWSARRHRIDLPTLTKNLSLALLALVSPA